jgi:hypothetical protein
MLGIAFRLTALTWIKLLHTVIWSIFAGCILLIPVLGLLRRFRVAALLIGIVLVECVVVAANHFRCPLTNLASRHTADRAPNFDIFLPVWLARYNQLLFGSVFLIGALFVLHRYVSARRPRDE